MNLTPQQVYDKLVNEDLILQEQGQIRFFLGDVDIIVKQRDVVGNIIQEWLQGWLDHNGIAYNPNPNSQMPPDFYLVQADGSSAFLEVKAFNAEASPAFDIADFKGLAKALLNAPEELTTQFLIFAYNMSDEGVVTISNIWLKSIWEITRASEKWPLNVQYKNGEINKIRPCAAKTWELPPVKARGNKFPHFANLTDMLSAYRETLLTYGETHEMGQTWAQDLNAAFAAHGMQQVQIPWWFQISANYQ